MQNETERVKKIYKARGWHWICVFVSSLEFISINLIFSIVFYYCLFYFNVAICIWARYFVNMRIFLFFFLDDFNVRIGERNGNWIRKRSAWLPRDAEDFVAAVIIIAEWEACTEVAAAVAAVVAVAVAPAVIISVFAVAIEEAEVAIANPLIRVIQQAKIASPTNSPPLNRRQMLSKRRGSTMYHRYGVKESK